ncbi:MAG: hypothetical protein EBU08_12575 [Micrococcales bacterium]|nr:hypothetical protein [Micrococcales bacterium]
MTTVIVDNTTDTTVVTVQTPGPQGPAGAAAYVFTQSTPATTWTINHNLGLRPSVELLDTGSQEIEGEVSHPSLNQTVVTLSLATAGMARLT